MYQISQDLVFSFHRAAIVPNRAGAIQPLAHLLGAMPVGSSFSLVEGMGAVDKIHPIEEMTSLGLDGINHSSRDWREDNRIPNKIYTVMLPWKGNHKYAPTRLEFSLHVSSLAVKVVFMIVARDAHVKDSDDDEDADNIAIMP